MRSPPDARGSHPLPIQAHTLKGPLMHARPARALTAPSFHPSLLAGISVADMNYFTCKKIRDVLTTDKDTAQKNWLGQYKTQATKDWEAILRLYEKVCRFITTHPIPWGVWHRLAMLRNRSRRPRADGVV